jgi:Right handed beta helix region
MKTKLAMLLVLLSTLTPQLSTLFAQGSLTPPGAPAPTMKTLDQVEPRARIPGGTTTFAISSAGSYYLSGNLAIATGDGIFVNASNVTIDLAGFEVAGTGGGSGVVINTGISNVRIYNGTIRNFTSRGIDGVGNVRVRVENVRSLNNGGAGIEIDVNGAVIDCLAQANGGAGIVGADNCVIRNCQSIGNTGAGSHGISVGVAAQISGCVTRSNAGSGINAGSGCALSDCVANNNGGAGMNLIDNCAITNCTGNNNTGDGLSVTSGGSPGANVHNSTFSGNTLSGINVNIGSDVTACTANSNGSQGINAALGGRVTDCTASLNTGNGIVLLGVCLAIGNNCRQNGAAGIVAQTGGGSRIEANNVVVNIAQGILVTTTNCLILRNSARSNFGANYSIAADNRYGPIVDITAAGTAAVNGSSAPDALTANGTHPWANFSY